MEQKRFNLEVFVSMIVQIWWNIGVLTLCVTAAAALIDCTASLWESWENEGTPRGVSVARRGRRAPELLHKVSETGKRAYKKEEESRGRGILKCSQC